MAEQTCACHADSVLIFSCSGSSNVGQISNTVGVELTRQGKARMYCLAGMGAHVSGMINSAAGADYRIALDGCPVACARKTLEYTGLQVNKAVVITELGIFKNHDFEWSHNEFNKVMEATISGIPIMAGEEGCGCGCEIK